MIKLPAVMTDIVAYICHVLQPVHRHRIGEAGCAAAGSSALDPHIGVAESSYDHMVLHYGGVGLHRFRSSVLSGQYQLIGSIYLSFSSWFLYLALASPQK